MHVRKDGSLIEGSEDWRCTKTWLSESNADLVEFGVRSCQEIALSVDAIRSMTNAKMILLDEKAKQNTPKPSQRSCVLVSSLADPGGVRKYYTTCCRGRALVVGLDLPRQT